MIMVRSEDEPRKVTNSNRVEELALDVLVLLRDQGLENVSVTCVAYKQRLVGEGQACLCGMRVELSDNVLALR